MTQPNQNLATTPSSQRFAIVDILRAYALLGVAIINYTSFRDWDSEHGSRLDLYLGYIANYVFFRKSALLLSVLFGYGFAVLMDNLKQKGTHVVAFFTKRMFWLFVIAFVNSCFFEGDILKSYAILGVILLLFNRASNKTILSGAIFLLVLVPFSSGYTRFAASMDPVVKVDQLHPLFLSHSMRDVLTYNLTASYVLQFTWAFYAIFVHQVMLCCFLWGMFIHKIRFVENLRSNKKAILRLFWFSIPAFALSAWLTWLTARSEFLKLYANFFIVSFLCAMVFFATGIMWLHLAGKLKALFKLMELYGKMTLTNYIMQNVISFFLFSGAGLGIGGSKPYSFYFILAVIIFIVQLFLSKYWLSIFNYGPVEFVWRNLSSQKTLPFKKAGQVIRQRA